MPDQTIIEKIKKLLALTTSSNENESTIAAEKASLLLAQHNLSLADLGNTQDTEITETVIDKTTRFVTWKMILLSGIADANFCQALRSNYNGNVYLLGSATNLIVCQHLYNYLSKAIERRAKYRKGSGRAYLNAFRVGCATRLSERLLAQKHELETSGIAGTSDTPATPAIVVRSMFEKNKLSIDDYLENRGVTVRSRSNSQISSEKGYHAGIKVGDQISLNKPMPAGQNIKRLQPKEDELEF
ncbi:DUF2786 domain-containing protein [Ancylothrix sp. C2]|uniref:DUF2786 domain-containing protein n=1 Tax=Ancylothrix sp. D3o TaxID=2953691 RepID=UPI0021BB1A57|nr:DUF2786 domain-containing protein [Ancylothrix sp. D3o]MCT7950422.1 DUF2786 domain-containing protein [Ancylothrix sp. D3o]